MKQLVIFGVQNFADMAHYLFTHDSDYEVCGFSVDGTYMTQTHHLGLPVIPYDELLNRHPPGTVDIFVAIGITQLNQAREDKVKALQNDGYNIASYISSHTRPPEDFSLKPNTLIMDQVLIHPFVEIGSNTIIWTNSRIALKTKIEDNCWITSAVIGESCIIGRNTFVGLDVIIAPNLHIGAYNVFGAGALITKKTKDYEVYKGVRAIRSRLSSKRLHKLSILV